MEKLSCLMFVGCAGHTANTDQQRQCRWNIYVLYGPPHSQYALFALDCIPRSMAIEIILVLISSDNIGGFGSVMFASQALPHLLILGFCALLGWELAWGTFSSSGAFAESVRNICNYSLQFYYQLVVLPCQISSTETSAKRG